MISAPTVLIIDDDEDDVDLFKEALSEINRGIICISKSNGKVGLEYLKNSGKSLPQFIFLDLNMPFIDGKQFLKEVGKIERLAAIPVIIYTTSRQKMDEEETRKLGAVDFITKPASFEELCRLLKLCLRRHQLIARR